MRDLADDVEHERPQRHQARLKILGRARIIDEDGDAELLARLDNAHYGARVERGIVIRIAGFDWNCPK